MVISGQHYYTESSGATEQYAMLDLHRRVEIDENVEVLEGQL